MATLSASQHLAALQFPWHAKRARPQGMMRNGSDCSGSGTNPSRVTSPVDKESLRRQIVGLALKREGNVKVKSDKRETVQSPNPQQSKKPTVLARARTSGYSGKRNNARVPSATPNSFGTKGIQNDLLDTSRNAINRSKSAMNVSSESRNKPKIVRFRMEEHAIGRQKAPIVTISDTINLDKKGLKNVTFDTDSPTCEIRGSAIAVRKEGLKGLMEYKTVCNENEKRQNSLQASLKIFRRRIKLNTEKFIQPGETTNEDYVIHTARTPFCDVNNTMTSGQDNNQASRPMSSEEHVRILRSALHNKHNGIKHVVARQIENGDNADTYGKNIKCSYRLPENLNWSKGVSFKDIKDDSIPNVKTYVLEEEKHGHGKYKTNSTQTSVTLNTHNLNVHNSITQVNEQKMKVGDSEVSFDPRFLEWLEDSLSNSTMHRTATFMTDDTLECCSTPSVKRRVAAKT